MKALFIAFILFVTALPAISQCDKKVNWHGSKGEMYDAGGTLLDTRIDSIIFKTDSQKIFLKLQADDKGLEGTVKEKVCDWKEPFRNGKTIYHATVSIDGQESNAILILEGKDGKITLSLTIDALNDKKYKVYIDRYEEVK